MFMKLFEEVSQLPREDPLTDKFKDLDLFNDTQAVLKEFPLLQNI